VSVFAPLRLDPSVDDEDGARALLAQVKDWALSHGLPELPPEHRALAELPFGVHLDLRRLGDAQWGELMLSQHTAAGLGTWLSWMGPGGRGGVFVPPGVAWVLSPVLYELMQRLGGEEIELRYALAGRFPLLPRDTWVHPDGWWDEWKSRPLGLEEQAPTLGSVYRGWLYPRVLGCLRTFAASGEPARRVVDVCGGDGELAASLGEGHEVVLIERNAAAASEARARGLRVVEGDAASASSWRGLTGQDVVLLVGAVQGNVMGWQAAEATVAHAARALRPGGLAIVTGWSHCLLDAAGFRRAGFEVHNCAVPPSEADPNPRQLYLLRRLVTEGADRS
jgi:SAM-dependent methyltransferase